jgi:uncharacterized membrane protein
MSSPAKLLGHPIHQILIVFPVGLLITGEIFDVVRIVSGNPFWGTIAYWMIGPGIIGGLVAAVFGYVDLQSIPLGTRAKKVGFFHGVGNVIVVALFGISWLLRRPDPGHPSGLAATLTIAGVALLAVTGWLGGELVNRLGVGVDEGAHPDAPSSLSQRTIS